MTDDIVTRLRDIVNLRGDLSGHVIPLACLNAADEVERLREENERLKDALARVIIRQAVSRERK
jgi:hypothetical protein